MFTCTAVVIDGVAPYKNEMWFTLNLHIYGGVAENKQFLIKLRASFSSVYLTDTSFCCVFVFIEEYIYIYIYIYINYIILFYIILYYIILYYIILYYIIYIYIYI